MGSPKFPRKKYTTPFHPWKEDRIKSERELMKKYGLKNHKEVWKAKTYLGKYRGQARELLAKMGAKEDPQVKKESDQLLLHLTRMGILSAGSSLDDVLALETESVLSRRLQTLVYLKGLSTTPDQSRQLISHGHIAIGERKVTIPSYMVIKDEENKIGYTGVSPLNELSHPARPKTDVYKSVEIPTKEEKTKEEKKPVKPKEESDIKQEKDKDTKDTTEDAAESVKKSEEKNKSKDVKEEKTEEPSESKEASDRKEEKTKEGKKEDIESAKEEKTDASEKIKEETTKEKPAVEKETTEPAEKSKSTKQEKPAKEEKPEPPSKAEEEKPTEEKTEPVKKSETGNKNAKETNKKKGEK